MLVLDVTRASHLQLAMRGWVHDPRLWADPEAWLALGAIGRCLARNEFLPHAGPEWASFFGTTQGRALAVLARLEVMGWLATLRLSEGEAPMAVDLVLPELPAHEKASAACD